MSALCTVCVSCKCSHTRVCNCPVASVMTQSQNALQPISCHNYPDSHWAVNQRELHRKSSLLSISLSLSLSRFSLSSRSLSISLSLSLFSLSSLFLSLSLCVFLSYSTSQHRLSWHLSFSVIVSPPLLTHNCIVLSAGRSAFDSTDVSESHICCHAFLWFVLPCNSDKCTR